MKKTLQMLIVFAFLGLNGMAQTAYIPNFQGHSITMINVATNTIIDSVVLPANIGPYGVSVSPDGNRVYFADYNGSQVSVLNTATNVVSDIITFTNNPSGICVSPDGSKAYVVNYSNTVNVINTSTNLVTANITAGNLPFGITVSPDGNRVYVTSFNSNSLIVINAVTNTIIDSVTVCNYPGCVIVSHDGSKVYVASQLTSVISVINTTNDSVIHTISTPGDHLYGLSWSHDGSKLYVASRNNNTVYSINTSTNLVSATIPVGSLPFGLSTSPDGTKVLVANSGDNTVSIINTSTNTVVATIPVSIDPRAIGNFISVFPATCSAQFSLYADTFQLHHYFILNNAIGNGPLHYDWNWGDTTAHDTIAYPSHTYADSGLYDICLTITDSVGCSSNYCYNGYHILRTANTMYWVNVISPSQVGIKEININNSISIFPNPASTLLNIHHSTSTSQETLLITDLLGTEVYKENLTGIDNTISISTWSAGIYFYEVRGSALQFPTSIHGKFVKL